MKSRPDQNNVEEQTSVTEGRVLVVEDESLLGWSLMNTLSRAGYDTIVAESGEEAIEKLNTSHVDLVITDVKLPRANGFDVVSVAKSLPIPLPVIVMSVQEEESVAEMFCRVGADCFLHKPFDLCELVEHVKRLLKRSDTQ